MQSLREAVCTELGLSSDTPWSILALTDDSVLFSVPSERQLAVAILQLPDVIRSTLEHLTPHLLCEHAHTLAQRFHSFYASCRIVGDARMQQRIILCSATDAALRVALSLLGVAPLNQL
jgi:arginyl-tRNA synthetase